MNTQEIQTPSHLTGIDTMAVEMLKKCTVTDEKASIKVGGHKYTSTTKQAGRFSIITIRKDNELFCISIYADASGYKDHYEVRA